MKNNKGITLISLIVYIIGMIAIMTIISLAISFYTKNLEEINDTSDINAEFNKFVTSMIKETKNQGNAVQETTGNSITFTNGNKYIFQDGKIYQNTIAICKYVKEFSVNLETDGNKQMLRIYILLERGKIEIVKNLSYVIDKTESNMQNGNYSINGTGYLTEEQIPVITPTDWEGIPIIALPWEGKEGPIWQDGKEATIKTPITEETTFTLTGESESDGPDVPDVS